MNLFPSDQMIELRGPWITNWSLPKADQASKLLMVSLIDTAVTDYGIRRLRAAVNLTEFSMRSILISDRSMPVLCGLPELRSLIFWYAPRITDNGIACLLSRQSLYELCLTGSCATDHSVNSILHIENLHGLDLESTRITDSGVEKLAALRNLSSISLGRNRIKGHTLSKLPDSPHLGIGLENCPVDDGAIIRAAECLENLKSLNLNGTLVTDSCLPALSKLPKLETLWLDKTPVTDAGIMNLKGHPVLAVLYLRKTPVSEAAIQELKDASPQKLRIYNK